jgi:hypothetical protein
MGSILYFHGKQGSMLFRPGNSCNTQESPAVPARLGTLYEPALTRLQETPALVVFGQSAVTDENSC